MPLPLRIVWICRVSCALSSSCSGLGRPRSAKTFPLPSVTRETRACVFLALVFILVLPIRLTGFNSLCIFIPVYIFIYTISRDEWPRWCSNFVLSGVPEARDNVAHSGSCGKALRTQMKPRWGDIRGSLYIFRSLDIHEIHALYNPCRGLWSFLTHFPPFPRWATL